MLTSAIYNQCDIDLKSLRRDENGMEGLSPKLHGCLKADLAIHARGHKAGKSSI